MIETLIPALLQSASNIYLIILLTLLVIAYVIIKMFSSGQIYRIRISKADTNLNIIEKLIEKKDVQLTDYQKTMCSTVITESLINISTGYKLSVKNIQTYEQALSITGKPYISNFAAKIKTPLESIRKSTKKYLLSSFFVLLLIVLMIIVGSAVSGFILSKTQSPDHIILDLKDKIALLFDIIIMFLLFFAYIIQFNRFSSTLILYLYCLRYENLGDFVK